MKRKIYLELGITLIVGFLIGFFVNSIITDRRIKDFSMHKGEWLFWNKVLTDIQATEEQEEAIYPIIKEYSDKTRDILHESWEKIPPIWEEMDKEIMNHLTPEQQKQIKEIQDKRKKYMDEFLKSKRNNQEHNRGNKGEGRGKYHNDNGNNNCDSMPPPPPPPFDEEN